MGYTHYWKQPTRLNQETWNKFVADCKVLYKNMPKNSESSGAYAVDEPLHIGGCYTSKYPKFTKECVLFNGSSVPPKDRKKDSQGDWENDNCSHETFVLKRTNTSGDFCKTARKPYDLMVQACLLLYKYYFWDEVTISSDGNFDDWVVASQFVGKHFPEVHIKFNLMPDKFGINK